MDSAEQSRFDELKKIRDAPLFPSLFNSSQPSRSALKTKAAPPVCPAERLATFRFSLNNHHAPSQEP